MAINKLEASGRSISAVVFGHMHHSLHGWTSKNPLYRKMLVEDASKIPYINGAVVPRISFQTKLHHFTIFELESGTVDFVDDVWVKVGEEVCVQRATRRVANVPCKEDINFAP